MDDCTLVSLSLEPRFPYLYSVASRLVLFPLYPLILPDLFRIMIIYYQFLVSERYVSGSTRKGRNLRCTELTPNIYRLQNEVVSAASPHSTDQGQIFNGAQSATEIILV
jgi:hypothetical protein